jgi:O-antigen/teichoic acid export membrane protein
LRGIWQTNSDLLRNAGSLAATTGLTSVFGFVFWIIAARQFSPSAVGYGSAAISAMMLLGTVGMFGLGTVLIGELPRRNDRGALIAAALIASGLGSLALGVLFPALAAACGAHFPELTGTAIRLLIFAVGVGLTGVSLVFDEATIGLLRGGVQLTRNLVMSLGKLAVLPLTAMALHDTLGVQLILAWVLGTALSLIVSACLLKRSGARIFHRPDWGLLRRLSRVVMAHNWLNLAIATPPKLIPVLVIIVVSPSANAAFYIAFMLASFLFMVPLHLSTVLFAIASASPELIAEKLRFVLRVSLVIGLPAMAVLAIGAHFLLGIFGSDYSQLATVPLWLFILGYIPGLPKSQYIAVCRATGRVTKAAIVLTIAMCCELIAVIVGGKLGGLNGLCIGYTIVVFLEGIVTAPTVLRAAYARTAAHARTAAATPRLATADLGPASGDVLGRVSGPFDRLTGPLTRLTGPFPRLTGPIPSLGQDPAITALASLATAAVSEGHALDVATWVWRSGTFPAVSSDLDLGYREAADAHYDSRQQAGIAALIALATGEQSGPPVQHQQPDAGKLTSPRGVARRGCCRRLLASHVADLAPQLRAAFNRKAMPRREVRHVGAQQLCLVSENMLDRPLPPRNLQERLPQWLVETPADVTGGNAAHDLVRRHILRDDRPGRDRGAVTDRHTAQHESVKANPDIAADDQGPPRRNRLWLSDAHSPVEEEGCHAVNRVLAARHQDDRLVDRAVTTDPCGRIIESAVHSHRRMRRLVNNHHIRTGLPHKAFAVSPMDHRPAKIHQEPLPGPRGGNKPRSSHELVFPSAPN